MNLATLPPRRDARKSAPTVENRTADVQTSRQARLSGLGQPAYLAYTLDVQRIQNALRSAERGDTWLLFTIFRDMYASYGHLQTEWAKRKCVITGNPQTLIPYDADDKDDKIACEVIQQMIDNCGNWYDGLNHLLDATLYPLAAAEKIFEPVGRAENLGKHKLRYKLKEIAPVDPILLCFKLPYIPGFTSIDNPAGKFDPDDWEAWLRFYATDRNGVPKYTMQDVYAPNPNYHIVHRSNMLSSVIPPNFGGHMRTILFPWLLSTQDRDWWALMMQKYGMPIPVGKVNTQQMDTVAYMQQALALCAQLGGIVIDTKAEIEWGAITTTDIAGAHKMFQDWCDCNTSKIVIGQSLSAKPEKTGMGSGAAQQSEEIREDYRIQDTMKLDDTLKKQLYRQFLDINGYAGHAPTTRWGGMREGAAATLSKTLAQNATAGLVPSPRGMRTVNEKFGIEFELHIDMVRGKGTNPQDGDNDGKVKY